MSTTRGAAIGHEARTSTPTGPAFLGLKETIRLTGLTKAQLRIIEGSGSIGHVLRWRPDMRRMYTADQVRLLVRIREIRSALDLTFEEAGQLAHEAHGGGALVSLDRVHALRRKALSDGRRRLELALFLDELAERRPPPK